MTFQNPNLVVDESVGYSKITHSDIQSLTTVALDDQNSDLFAQLPEFPQGRSVSSPQTADYAADADADADACHQGLKRDKLNPELTTGEKIQVLVETLKPIPFIPSEALDLKSHESLLRRLGLWDFVNIEFDATIRGDLLAQLIASYNPNLSFGYVNGIVIMVNRADLGRALKLPMEPSAASPENELDELKLSESVAFIEKLVSMWMVLHDNEWIMPPEVLACIRLIEEGHFEMIDWAGLNWSMVKNELNELKASQLQNCYYASHLQQLIKTQHEGLLREGRKVENEVSNKEEEGELLREHNVIELSQEQDDDGIFEMEKEQAEDEPSMDVEDFKEESGKWPLLQPCNVSNQKSSEEDEFEDEDEDDCIFLGGKFSRSSSLGMPSGSFIPEMEAGQIPFNSRNNGLSDNSEDLLTFREDAQMASGSSLFGNGHKRYVDQDDDHNLYQTPIVGNKRLRSDNLWDSNPVDFNMCMENIQPLIGEASMMYITKAQACEEASMKQQLLLTELQNRDEMIEHLRKQHLEESQKGRMQVNRLEMELHKMGKLLEGYRKALKETQKAFTEYRTRCPPEASEPLYKDVPGSGSGSGSGAGGLVLTAMEQEQEQKRLKKQQMKRLVIEKKLRDFEQGWISKLEEHQNRIHSLGERLTVVEDQAKLFMKVKPKC